MKKNTQIFLTMILHELLQYLLSYRIIFYISLLVLLRKSCIIHYVCLHDLLGLFGYSVNIYNFQAPHIILMFFLS